MKLVFAVCLIACLPWVFNFIKLTNCDFEPSYRCEVIHGIGVFIPPTAWITVWFDTDR